MTQVYVTQEQFDIIRMRSEQHKGDTDVFKYYIEGDFEMYEEDVKLQTLTGYAIAMAWLNPGLVGIHKKHTHHNYDNITANEVIQRYVEGKTSYYKNAFDQYVMISKTLEIGTLVSFASQLYKIAETT
jgi:hypothetical protein